MEPVLEIYTRGLTSIAIQAEIEAEGATEKFKTDLAVLLPQTKSLEQKIESQLDFVDEMPRLVASGDGSLGFQFQKNYILLAYYCLI